MALGQTLGVRWGRVAAPSIMLLCALLTGCGGATASVPASGLDEIAVGSTQPTAEPQQPTAEPQQPTADPQQPTADPQQPTADPQQPTADPALTILPIDMVAEDTGNGGCGTCGSASPSAAIPPCHCPSSYRLPTRTSNWRTS